VKKKSVSLNAAENSVLLALAKGICPICTLVRAFQNELIERLQPNGVATVCNYHAWAIAGSAPAVSVAEVFLAMLRGTNSSEIGREHTDCDLCWSIREHQFTRLQEFAREMQHGKFAEWVEQYGTLCHYHGTALDSMLPPEHARIISNVMDNNRQQLEELLESFAEKARSGCHAGGGILGRAAEFLVAQRGLTR
jgi:hypothetical protein